MTWFQRFSMFLAAALMCTLTATTSCSHLPARPDADAQAQTDPDAASPDAGTPPDAGAADADADDAPAAPVAEPQLMKKPAWWPHFVPEVTLKGEITPALATQVEAMVAAFNASRHDTQQDPVEGVVLVIDSPGGRLDAGADIVRALQSLEMPLVCVVSGTADSMAALIVETACPIRLATPESSLMFHEPSFQSDVKVHAGGRWEFNAIAESFRVDTEGWMSVVATRMGVPLASLMSRIKNDQWWVTADEALRARLIDGICYWGIARDVTIPLQSTMTLPSGLKLQAPAPRP